jgi:hypothetical protein
VAGGRARLTALPGAGSFEPGVIPKAATPPITNVAGGPMLAASARSGRVARIPTTERCSGVQAHWTIAAGSSAGRDSEALIEHAAHLGDLSEAILGRGSVSGELLCEPSAELRANSADSVVRLFMPYLSV